MERKTRLETIIKTLDEAKAEKGQLHCKIELIRARLSELEAITRDLQPVVPKLEVTIKDLESRRETIQDTLESLMIRKHKVLYISNKFH